MNELAMSLEKFRDSFKELSERWGEVDSSLGQVKYPWNKSFDDLVPEVEEWIDNFLDEVE